MKNVIEQLNRVAAEPAGSVSRVYVASDEAMTLRAGLEALALAERLAAEIRNMVERLHALDKKFGGDGTPTPQTQLYSAWADALEGVANVGR